MPLTAILAGLFAAHQSVLTTVLSIKDAVHPTAGEPLWFTMADCIASKILTGNGPRVVKAVSFEAGAQQEGLDSIRIAGNPDYEVDPATNDSSTSPCRPASVDSAAATTLTGSSGPGLT